MLTVPINAKSCATLNYEYQVKTPDFEDASFSDFYVKFPALVTKTKATEYCKQFSRFNKVLKRLWIKRYDITNSSPDKIKDELLIAAILRTQKHLCNLNHNRYTRSFYDRSKTYVDFFLDKEELSCPDQDPRHTIYYNPDLFSSENIIKFIKELKIYININAYNKEEYMNPIKPRPSPQFDDYIKELIYKYLAERPFYSRSSSRNFRNIRKNLYDYNNTYRGKYPGRYETNK